MIDNDAFQERGRALEDQFFHDRDKQLLEKLREQTKSDHLRDALTSTSGINDDKVLDELIAQGLTAENMVAISIVPLIEVAWADSKMEKSEIEAILKAADQTGIKQGSTAYELIESWLVEKPEEDLLNAWKDYVRALKEILAEPSFTQLKDSVMHRARDVAAAAGGFLGLGNKISAVEQKVLNELEAVFSG